MTGVATSDGLSAAFRAALAAASTSTSAGELVGLEHEYRLGRGAMPIDFRRLIHSLEVPGKRLDPGDLNAYRLESGLVLTCDDAEAEIASPPLPVKGDFTREIRRWARSMKTTNAVTAIMNPTK